MNFGYRTTVHIETRRAFLELDLASEGFGAHLQEGPSTVARRCSVHLVPLAGRSNSHTLPTMFFAISAIAYSPAGPALCPSCVMSARAPATVALAYEVPVLERAPPAPPPVDDGGGGGGGGGGGSEFLRLLNVAEQQELLADWTSRSRIYRMTSDSDLVQAHTEAIREMEELSNFDTTGPPGESGRKMILGLFEEDKVCAMAGAEVSHASGLVVSSLIVYPAELNDDASTAALRLVHALYLLADAIDTPLDMRPVNEDGREPCCISRSSSESSSIRPDWPGDAESLADDGQL